jgi:tRNA-2-methylthio-N6-dimethylallyladenosine synthase
MELITKLRNQIPGIAITTDLIAGFPGETEEQFENTIKAMKSIEFDFAFCFKYSTRDGTKSANLPNQVDESLRLHRLQRLIGAQHQHTKLNFQAKIGSIVEVLVEGKSKLAVSHISVKTRYYKICAFDGSDNQIGTLVKVKIFSATAGTLVGDQVNK